MSTEHLTWDVKPCWACEGSGEGNDTRLGRARCDVCRGTGKTRKLVHDEKYRQWRIENKAIRDEKDRLLMEKHRATPYQGDRRFFREAVAKIMHREYGSGVEEKYHDD